MRQGRGRDKEERGILFRKLFYFFMNVWKMFAKRFYMETYIMTSRGNIYYIFGVSYS